MEKIIKRSNKLAKKLSVVIKERNALFGASQNEWKISNAGKYYNKRTNLLSELLGDLLSFIRQIE